MQSPAASPKVRPVSASTRPIAKQAFGFAEARHLLWRAGFGGTPQQVQLLASWGPEKAVEHLVKFESVPGEEAKPDLFASDIIRPPTADERTEYQRAARARDEDTLARFRARRQEGEQKDREQMRRVQQWWLGRLIETPRPLEEKMTLFWHGLFATSYRTIEDSYHMFVQNQLFRTHAAGSYADLLGAIIRDPAMIAYLDNNDSRKGKPNENLAREIMELFSLGVGNYTEQDIKEGARALTGYSFEDDAFTFQRNNHDNGRKNILGASGTIDGEDFVGIILQQPACARHIATRLYRFFVADYPSGRKRLDDAGRAVIADMASGLEKSNYNLRPVLTRLFLSQHFYDPALRNEQIKSPVQLVVGAIRSLGTPARDLATVNDGLNIMGQSLFFPPSVKGWDGGRSWINTATMFVRQNALVYLLSGKKPKGKDALADEERFDGVALLSHLADAYPESAGGDAEKVVDAILAFAIGHDPDHPPAARAELIALLAAKGSKLDPETLTHLMMLITAMPEYQLC
ncbi:MAG: DUF1800 family protein [Phycisphaerales bacterium]